MPFRFSDKLKYEIFHTEVKTKFNDKFLNFVFQFIKNMKWRLGTRNVCIYVKENIASKQLNLHLDKETEPIYLEINIRLRK